jgi:hypothetical protein
MMEKNSTFKSLFRMLSESAFQTWLWVVVFAIGFCVG